MAQHRDLFSFENWKWRTWNFSFSFFTIFIFSCYYFHNNDDPHSSLSSDWRRNDWNQAKCTVYTLNVYIPCQSCTLHILLMVYNRRNRTTMRCPCRGWVVHWPPRSHHCYYYCDRSYNHRPLARWQVHPKIKQQRLSIKWSDIVAVHSFYPAYPVRCFC